MARASQRITALSHNA